MPRALHVVGVRLLVVVVVVVLLLLPLLTLPAALAPTGDSVGATPAPWNPPSLLSSSKNSTACPIANTTLYATAAARIATASINTPVDLLHLPPFGWWWVEGGTHVSYHIGSHLLNNVWTLLRNHSGEHRNVERHVGNQPVRSGEKKKIIKKKATPLPWNSV